MEEPSTASLERDAGLSDLRALGSDLSDPRSFNPWRLSGLLSGYLPTDTRPQARAKLGKGGNMSFDSVPQGFFCCRVNFFHNTREVLRRERENDV